MTARLPADDDPVTLKDALRGEWFRKAPEILDFIKQRKLARVGMA